MSRLFQLFHERLVAPILYSKSSIPETSLGVAVGAFVGLTPTMGLQMYIAALIWMFARYILKCHFNLPVSVAMVWITNPVTVVPIYYMFLTTGVFFFKTMGIPSISMTYDHFKETFISFAELPSIWEQMIEGTKFLVIDLGFPMLVGSLFYAIPFSIIGYFLCASILKRRQSSK